MAAAAIGIGAGPSQLMSLYQFGAYTDCFGIGPVLFVQETTVKGADIYEFDKWSFVCTENPERI